MCVCVNVVVYSSLQYPTQKPLISTRWCDRQDLEAEQPEVKKSRVIFSIDSRVIPRSPAMLPPPSFLVTCGYEQGEQGEQGWLAAGHYFVSSHVLNMASQLESQ